MVVMDGQFMYVNYDGTPAFPHLDSIQWGWPFTDGLACVKTADGAFGVIDRNGSFVIGPSEQLRLGHIAGGLVPFRRLDAKGQVVAAGYMDRTGAVRLKLRPDQEPGRFEGPLARVKTLDGWGWIDMDGKWVWKTKEESTATW